MDPLKLLEPDPEYKPNVFYGIWGPLIGGIMGFGFGVFSNFLMRRPVFATIPKHFVFAGVGSAIGSFLDKHQDKELAERDAVLRRYIELHPEDFVLPGRQKYSEVFTKWIPIR